MSVLLATLMPDYANAELVSFNDPEIKPRYMVFPSPDGHGEGRGYPVVPTALKGKAPVVLVVHLFHLPPITSSLIKQGRIL